MRLWHRDLTTSSRGAAAGHLARNGYKKAATASRSRGADASELIQLPTLESKRVQGKPGASRTRSLASNRKKDTSIHHRFSRITDLPCAMVLTVSFVLTSERPGSVVSLAGGYVSTGLAPASGRQACTPSPSVDVRHVEPPVPVHRIPSHVRDVATAPLVDGTKQEHKVESE
jgi:hypothetical protein